MTTALADTVEVCSEGEACRTCLACRFKAVEEQRDFYYRVAFETAAAAREVLGIAELEPPRLAVQTIEWAENAVQKELAQPPKMSDLLDYIAAAYRWLRRNGSWAQHELLLIRAEHLLIAAGREPGE